ncbi:ferric reductase [Methanohalobium sp.]|uniref:ferric reductase n=1 Tax=Methanohalobium sp. TaxID=2837493 RepID=UPI00397C38B8
MIYTIYQNPESPIKLIYRASGIFGYLLVFSAIVSSEYMTQIKKLFGQTFLKFHHNIIKLAFILMVLHPVSFALDIQNLQVFLPVFYPPVTFLELAGRPALYIFVIVIITAVYRKKIIKNWKKIHLFNYLAFFMVSIHALLIGTDFSSTGMKILSFSMMATVTGIFVHKRLKKSKLRR